MILAGLPRTLLAQADRIAGPVDGTRLLPVPGNVNPRATAAADEGPVDPATKLNYIQLVLKPSAAQQTDLNNLLSDQQNPRSPNFRKWLTPEQYADRFGVSPADIAKITEWLRSQGFDVITVARGRKYIAFNATAQQIQSALKTEIHHYRVDGELHFANATAPSVPAAIQPLVLSFLGLNDFRPKPALHGKAVKRRYTGPGGGHLVSPGDLAIIYDLTPVYQSGVTGSGQYIAVIGQSDVQLSDIATFRSDFGLSANAPQLILVPGSTDPGLVSGDEGESDLDLEYAGGMAYDATVLFVYSTGVYKSFSYAVDQALAPVISYSYAGCEPDYDSSDAQSLETLAQQANAEGITWLVASGDDGAAMCDTTQATHGLAVSLEAALPEATGVGGTMFTGGNSYWSSQNNFNQTSALSYIPETVWNESTNSQLSAGGGGYSIFFAQPAWQVGQGVTAGNPRGVPDISLTAAPNDDPYAVVESGQDDEVGGTSASTPVFAGMVLLLNQYLGTNGLGNINPSLYFMAGSTPSDFHDITTGNNAVPCVANSTDCSSGFIGYNATLGWDPASGLGSVDATNMFNDWSVGAGNPQIVNVLNGASFTNTGLSPGQFFTIFGANLGPVGGQGLELDQNGNVATYLAGFTVLVNGTAAPLLYVSPTQINAIAPYEIASSIGQYASVQVYDNNISSGAFNVKVVAAAPAIFPLGNGQGAILNQNYTVNGPGNPAARGSLISIYGTGQGQTNPAGVDGQINGSSPASLPVPVGNVSVTIGGVKVPASKILFAGDAPYSVDGFFQVDVIIPSSVGSGNQPVVLSIGGAAGAPANVAIQ
ncbi:MAG: protease pro-enzyme activation domain-containing protein [Bryobacteraceae bacterium]